MNQQTTNEHIKELTITRTFNANRELVFSMWTKPELFSTWYGPKGITVTECRIELRPGGEYYAMMKMPDGWAYPSTGIFREINPPEKLVFSLLSNVDDKGEPQMEMLNSVLFEEVQGKTKVTMNITEVRTMSGVIPLKGLDRAWESSFDKLAEVLKKK